MFYYLYERLMCVCVCVCDSVVCVREMGREEVCVGGKDRLGLIKSQFWCVAIESYRHACMYIISFCLLSRWVHLFKSLK